MADVYPGMPPFSITPTRIAFGTALTGLIPPYPGPGGVPFLYGKDQGGKPNWLQNLFTRITSLVYTTAGTAHTLTVLRPLNFVYFTAAVAKNTTAVTISADPGVYSTNYNYPTPGGAVPTLAADNAIAASDYVAYQMDDGVWALDTAAGSYSAGALTLTTGTPNRTGATIAAGRPLFFFGVAADTDPATGIAHQNFLTITSSNKVNQLGDYQAAAISALHPGDPVVVYSNNATATGIIELVAGDYRKF